MLQRQNTDKRHSIMAVTLDELVPQDHLVRKIDAAINFSFIYDLVKDLYSEDKGRPSIDPVVLIKIPLIQYLFGIRSMRQTIKEIETNIAYRWFLGLDFHDPVPHFSTFGKNYERRFKDTNLFEQIFSHILSQAMNHGFVNTEYMYADSTHVKANANKRKYKKEIVQVEAKAYQTQLEKEINEDRIAHGKNPLPPESFPEVREVKVSTTDPESGLFVKNEKERVFAYSLHNMCDDNGFILHTVVKASNVHDSQVLHELFHRVKEKVGKPSALALDAGYKTPAVAKLLIDEEVRLVLPYTRPKTKKGYFRKQDFVYDEANDCYLCPNHQVLTYSTTNRKGLREYKSNPMICQECPFLSQCTQSKNHIKVVIRHIWQGYYEEAEHLRHTQENKEIYARRKETIERVFADMKEKHGLRWTAYRGLEKVSMQAMLVCAAMNLKKLATWLWRATQGSSFFIYWIIFSSK
jgi:transposase